MKKSLVASVMSLALFASSSNAMLQVFCTEPRAPMVYISRPTRPFCAATSNCTQFDVDYYRRTVREYFRQLQEYAEAVDRYYRSAGQYVECMSHLD
jgi:hypothetical protein